MGKPLGKAGPLTASVLFCASLGAAALMPAPKRLAVREVEVKPDAAAPFLSRPAAVVCDGGSVYVLDSADADIKIYSRDGACPRDRPEGPGSRGFRLPNDLDVFGGRLYVADSANRRLQILDADGEYVAGSPRDDPLARPCPERRQDPPGRPSFRPRADEKIISCFREDGTPVWRAVDPLRSGDAVHDALRNQVFIRRAPGGGFRIFRCFDDRVVRTMNADGFRTGEAATPESGLPLKKLEVPHPADREVGPRLLLELRRRLQSAVHPVS